MPFYLSVDLGTTGCRSTVFNEKLDMISYAYEEYGLITPKENFAEQDAELWWKLTLKTAKEAIAKAEINDIKGISISSQGITVVPVDGEIRPVCNALSWLDIRAVDEVKQIERDFGGENIFRLTGKRPDPAYSLPKILWLKNNRRDIFDKAFKFLMPMDFLIARLTGNCVTDRTMASGTLMYDLDGKCWSKKILDLYEIDENKLSKLMYAGENAGEILPHVAEELGINKDCIVAVGAQDQKCAAFASGLDKDTVTVSLGTAAAVTSFEKEGKKVFDPGRCPYVEENVFINESVINTAGTCLRWLRDLLFKGEDYDVMDKEAEKALEKGNSLLFFPYMNGTCAPHFHPDNTGIFHGITLAAERGDFALAVMEGIAFQIRSLLEETGTYSNTETLVVFGGGANTSLWPKIIADVTNLTVKVPKTPQTAAAGAAMLVTKAMGEKMVTMGYSAEYHPSERREFYDKKYRKYKNIENLLWKRGENLDCD